MTKRLLHGRAYHQPSDTVRLLKRESSDRTHLPTTEPWWPGSWGRLGAVAPQSCPAANSPPTANANPRAILEKPPSPSAVHCSSHLPLSDAPRLMGKAGCRLTANANPRLPKAPGGFRWSPRAPPPPTNPPGLTGKAGRRKGCASTREFSIMESGKVGVVAPTGYLGDVG